MDGIRFVFSTVNYLSLDKSKELIDSFLKVFSSELDRLLIINNSDDQAEFLALANRYSMHDCLVFYNDGINRGYLQSALLALDRFLEDEVIEYRTFVMNNDMLFWGDRKNWLRNLGCLLSDQSVGCVGVNVVDDNGVSQGVFLHNRPSLSRYLYFYFITINKISYSIFTRIQAKAKAIFKFFHSADDVSKVNDAIDVYAVHGSFFYINANLRGKLNAINFPAFYAEEVVIAELCRELNLRCVYVEGLTLNHIGSQSFKKSSSAVRISYMHSSVKYFLNNRMYGAHKPLISLSESEAS